MAQGDFELLAAYVSVITRDFDKVTAQLEAIQGKAEEATVDRTINIGVDQSSKQIVEQLLDSAKSKTDDIRDGWSIIDSEIRQASDGWSLVDVQLQSVIESEIEAESVLDQYVDKARESADEVQANAENWQDVGLRIVGAAVQVGLIVAALKLARNGVGLLADKFRDIRAGAESNAISQGSFALQLADDPNASGIFAQIETLAVLTEDLSDKTEAKAAELRASFVELYNGIGDGPQALDLLSRAFTLSQNNLGDYEKTISTLSDALKDGVVDSQILEQLDSAIPGILNAVASITGDTRASLIKEFEGGSTAVDGFIALVREAIKENAILERGSTSIFGIDDEDVDAARKQVAKAQTDFEKILENNNRFIEEATVGFDELISRGVNGAREIGGAFTDSWKSVIFGTATIDEANAAIDRLSAQAFAFGRAAQDSFSGIDQTFTGVVDTTALEKELRVKESNLKKLEAEQKRIDKARERDQNRIQREITQRKKQDERSVNRLARLSSRLTAFDANNNREQRGQTLGFGELQGQIQIAVANAGAERAERDRRRNEILAEIRDTMANLTAPPTTPQNQPNQNLPKGRQGFLLTDEE